MKCNEGFCGMEFKIDKESNCCFFCEFKSKCNGICTTVEFHRSEDEIRNCSNLIVEKKEVKENLNFLGEKIYIITDGLGTEDYNYTTILLSDEY